VFVAIVKTVREELRAEVLAYELKTEIAVFSVEPMSAIVVLSEVVFAARTT